MSTNDKSEEEKLTLLKVMTMTTYFDSVALISSYVEVVAIYYIAVFVAMKSEKKTVRYL